MLYVIAYDIPDDARRLKLANVLEGFGQRVQRSVFECDLTEREYRALIKKVERVVNLNEGDSVRIYRLCGACVANVDVRGEGPPVEKSVDIYIV
ncbi:MULTISPECIES: CRISPR-associated endonuclease Cas2 [Roseiflexus]|jgi:CRISPR-associated protein Cas2|uniref:CRISPR-associated endoribonuclease Cas2 n=1 Tax=Roseiflexus castenholzii (strain DSM 13941 / HLO8) TaxID=383372 RepID=A7NKQ3_ROSCS|nr:MULTISPECIES: CRISPR-associated endonuclease Cas2 [Roseiflexus]ABU58073.1 CRISPR-associated protein Cas2 [Roseiflexus castenholzii DSM 13941]GIW00982.1 MAG: CRISPR-associated endoribonuclease Cas2 1 [Roseiflexus sp.]